MSVGNNIIRGTIKQGMLVVPVFRFESESSIFYGFYRKRNNEYCISLTDELTKFDGGTSDGGICVASVEFDSGRIKMKIAETSSIATSPRVQNYVNLTTDGSKIYTSISSIGNIGLSAVGMEGDGHSLYAGVWYRPTFSGKKLTATVWKPDTIHSGFPGSPDFTKETETTTSKTDYSPVISFIPFTRDVSVWTNSVCSESSAQQFALQRFTSWVRSRYMNGNPIYDTENCNLQTLGALSKNCLFVGTNCNLGVGYDYCMPYESCGSCFGKCENGGKCLANTFTKKFYCEQIAVKKTVAYSPPEGAATVVADPTPQISVVENTVSAQKNLGGQQPQTGTLRSSGRSGIHWIFLIILAVVILLVMFVLFWRHKK